MHTSQGIKNLSSFIKLMEQDSLTSSKGYTAWAKLHQAQMNQLFGYEQLEGMPPIYQLVRPDFHPDLPLILLNYTPSAHNLLYKFQSGWTNELRSCRGIVFDRNGGLVALPFQKFFNFGEHEETMKLPNKPFIATEKMDGHLGIIFWYNGGPILTSRGSFGSKTAVIGNRMLKEHAKIYRWQKMGPQPHLTLLCEIIHPDTKVLTDYEGIKSLCLIGAYRHEPNTEPHDCSYLELQQFQSQFGLNATHTWQGRSIADLRKLVADRTIGNKEGYVARYDNGLRIKFKFEGYIGRMIAEKLGYSYLMRCFLSGSLEEKLNLLPEEIRPQALTMLGEIMVKMSLKDRSNPQKVWQNLYCLAPNGSSYFQQVCRRFIKGLFTAFASEEAEAE